MPLGLIARLRVYSRPAAVLAAGLIAMQAVLAGLTIAQAALLLTPGLADLEVICHGSGGTASDDGTAPGPSQDRHPCCVSCTAAPPATLPEQSILLRVERGRAFQSPILPAATVSIAARAVRAGPSRAPPSLV